MHHKTRVRDYDLQRSNSSWRFLFFGPRLQDVNGTTLHKYKVKTFFVLHQILYLKMKHFCTAAITTCMIVLLPPRLFELLRQKIGLQTRRES